MIFSTPRPAVGVQQLPLALMLGSRDMRPGLTRVRLGLPRPRVFLYTSVPLGSMPNAGVRSCPRRREYNPSTSTSTPLTLRSCGCSLRRLHQLISAFKTARRACRSTATIIVGGRHRFRIEVFALRRSAPPRMLSSTGDSSPPSTRTSAGIRCCGSISSGFGHPWSHRRLPDVIVSDALPTSASPARRLPLSRSVPSRRR